MTLDIDRAEADAAVDATPPQRTHSGPLLIAGEDADYTRGALHVAELPARRDRVNAHPRDVDFAALGKEGWTEIHDHYVARLFEQRAALLTLPGDISVETVVLRGEPAATLLDHASRGNFDLVATGTQGQTELERHLTGSVSTAVLRAARSATLIAPPPRVSS